MKVSLGILNLLAIPSATMAFSLVSFLLPPNPILNLSRTILIWPSEVGPDCCEPMMQIFNHPGMQIAVIILASAYEHRLVKRNPSDLSEAFDRAASLGKSWQGLQYPIPKGLQISSRGKPIRI